MTRGFEKFKVWVKQFKELRSLPTDSLTVCLYIEYLIRSGAVYSAIESAYYGIRWAHNVYNLQNPREAPIVSNMLESAKRSLAKPVNKKEPVTPEMICKICTLYACPTASAAQLCTAALCICAYLDFLRYDELSSMRCCDVKMCSDSHVEIHIIKSN